MIEYRQVLELFTSYIFITIFIVSILIFYLLYHKERFLEERKARLLLEKRQAADFDKAHKNTTAIPKIDPEKLNALKNRKITTPSDWSSYKKEYGRVFENYLYRLRKKAVGITPAEERLVLLGNLRLNYREIAAMLGITPDAVRVTWYRMRKKMNIDVKITLNDFADSI